MVTFIVLPVLSLLFIGIGYILTENNSKYYLTGYWNLSEKEREKVDLKSFLTFFKRFHLLLGLSFLILGLSFYSLVSKKSTGVFIAVYPIIGYTFFFFAQKKYWKESEKR
jgi:hypothetical protein